MKYSLLAVDMDGTLLNSNKTIDEDTIEAINRLVDNDILFVIATGRAPRAILEYKNIIFNAPIISYNGALVIDAKTQKILYEQTMLYESAKLVYELGSKLNATMCIWANNILYSNAANEFIDYYKSIYKIEPIFVHDFSLLKEKNITKIVWLDKPINIEKFKLICEDKLKVVNSFVSAPYLLEFVDIKATKGNALKFIGELYHIPQNKIAAIGDSYNDLSMIDYAGLGVAMDNASLEIKKHANYITLSNDEGGVKHVIDNIILNFEHIK